MHTFLLILITTGSLLLSACKEDASGTGSSAPTLPSCNMHCAP